jgi:hypothetical protein
MTTYYATILAIILTGVALSVILIMLVQPLLLSIALVAGVWAFVGGTAAFLFHISHRENSLH